MSYSLEELLNQRGGQQIARRLLAEINAVAGTAGSGIKVLEVDGGQLKAYTTADKSDTPTTLDLPAEYFLDQTKTTLVQSFNFAGGSYTGATDPGLDGKPVMVLAVKGTDAAGTVTTTYSFLDMSALLDTYTSNSEALEISGRVATLKVASSAAVAEMLDEVLGTHA